jgi:hypothetical protein
LATLTTFTNAVLIDAGDARQECRNAVSIVERVAMETIPLPKTTETLSISAAEILDLELSEESPKSYESPHASAFVAPWPAFRFSWKFLELSWFVLGGAGRFLGKTGLQLSGKGAKYATAEGKGQPAGLGAACT